MKLKGIFAATLLMSSTSAFAIAFDQVDANGDGEITKDEFTQSQVFQSWDNNNDGQISREEAGDDWDDLGGWDTNDDDLVSENEFTNGVWTDWDADGDGVFDNNEWDDLGDEGWFDV